MENTSTPTPAALESQTAAGAESPAAPATAEAPQGIVAQAVAQLQQHGKLKDELAETSQKLQQAMTELQEKAAKVDELEAQLQAREEEAAQLRKALESSEGENKSVSKGVADQLAQLGVEEATAPPSTGSEEGEDTLESIAEQIAQEPDPAKRGQLASRYRALRDQ